VNAQCASCALLPGSEANKEPLSVLKAIISARGGIPFFCHHSRTTGEQYDWKSNESLGPLGLPHAERKLCDGWRREVARLKAAGKFRYGPDVSAADVAILRKYEKSLAHCALLAVEHFVGEKDPELKKMHRAEMDSMIRALFEVEEN
jgi:hypothetical protein